MIPSHPASRLLGTRPLRRLGALTAVAGGLAVIFGGIVASSAAQQGQLVVYSGRSKSLVEPVIQRFEKETGIRVTVRYANTPQLALALQQEGRRSPADLFWAQDAVALESLARADLLGQLSPETLGKVRPEFQGTSTHWLPTSGRARVLAYSPGRVSAGELPKNIFELTDPRWRGRIGWAPANASFQSFVTAMRHQHGEERTRQWLIGVRDNGAKAYAKNSPILQAIAAGEVDLGLVNHYYLLGMRADDPGFPVEQTFFEEGDLGNLLFTAGIGVLASSRRPADAQRLIDYLLDDSAQAFFASEVHEFPVTSSAQPTPQSLDPQRLEQSPQIAPEQLEDLEGTLRLLREVRLL